MGWITSDSFIVGAVFYTISTPASRLIQPSIQTGLGNEADN